MKLLQPSVTDIIEKLSTFPKLFGGTAVTTTGAIVTQASVQASDVVHPVTAVAMGHGDWFQIGVWVATILAGLTTTALGLLRFYLEWRKARSDKQLP
jgi:hypothetical protein